MQEDEEEDENWMETFPSYDCPTRFINQNGFLIQKFLPVDPIFFPSWTICFNALLQYMLLSGNRRLEI